ncbi:hypothetical protein LSAT2_013270 [Lamellibrachia satsuma]|nr:hypothetical protein LSAT2_013270 [Lamellibrachia satsuma]
MAEVKNWTKLTIPLLKQELANRNLDVKGRKRDLVSRLEQSDLASGDGHGSAEVNKEEDGHSATVEDLSGDNLELMDEFDEKTEEEEEEEMDDEDDEELDGENVEEGSMEESLLLEEGNTEEAQVEEGNREESLHMENTVGEEKEESCDRKNIEEDQLSDVENVDEEQEDESFDRNTDEEHNDQSFDRQIMDEEQSNQSSDVQIVDKEQNDESSDKEIVDEEHNDQSFETQIKDNDEDNDEPLDVDDMDLEGDEELEAEKTAEKKQESLKRFDLATLYIPKVDEIHKDLQMSQKFHVLYIYPLRTEIMTDPAVMTHFQHCSSIPCKFYPTDTPEGKVYEGYVILRFEFSEDALAAMEGLRAVLPSSVNIQVRQPSQTHNDMLSAINRSDIQGIDPWMKDNKNTKVVFVGNLPPTATEAALKKIFTGATIIRIARKDDSSSKGYAIVGYDTAKDAEQAAKEHMCARCDNYVLAVLYLSQADNRPSVDSFVDRQKLLAELTKFEQEIGLTSGKKKKSAERNATPVLKKPTGKPQGGVTRKDSVTPKGKKHTPMHLTGKNGQATKKTDKMNKSPATASDSQKAGGAKMEKKSSDDAEAEKKPRQRVRTSRWSKETESRGPQSAQVMEKIQQLQKKWERAPERQREQRGQRTGDTRQRFWRSDRSSGDSKRQYPYRADRGDRGSDKRYRMGQSSDAGRLNKFRPRMQSSLDTVYQQGYATGGGMAQGGSMGMGVGMGMGGGMGMGQGGGIVMGCGMGQAGGMGMGMGGGVGVRGGMNSVPSLLPTGQMGIVAGCQPMMASNVVGAGGGMSQVSGGMGQRSGGPGQGSGVAPASGTVNLLLGLTQILSKQLTHQPQRNTPSTFVPRRRDRRVRDHHSDT